MSSLDSQPPIVVVEVSGGVVYRVFTGTDQPANVRVLVRDLDDIAEGDPDPLADLPDLAERSKQLGLW